MSRSDRDRLLDILEASSAISDHLQRGPRNICRRDADDRVLWEDVKAHERLKLGYCDVSNFMSRN